MKRVTAKFEKNSILVNCPKCGNIRARVGILSKYLNGGNKFFIFCDGRHKHSYDFEKNLHELSLGGRRPDYYVLKSPLAILADRLKDSK